MDADYTFGDYLFGAMKLTKNADPYKSGYSSYSNEFDAFLQCSLSNDKWGKNVAIFGAGNSSSTHTDYRKKIS